ncbi:MAG: aromatic amino acid lyase, partial [Gemmatimonadaceae bacterium]|nr:aromatic amino acid lyase [Gemmatimonadaceae bacterium]
MPDTIRVGAPISIGDVVRVARGHARVVLASEAHERIVRSREYVESLVAADRTVYGITTGFGRLANVRIAAGDVQQLQRNLLLSHAMGVGVPLATDVVRASNT